LINLRPMPPPSMGNQIGTPELLRSYSQRHPAVRAAGQSASAMALQLSMGTSLNPGLPRIPQPKIRIQPPQRSVRQQNLTWTKRGIGQTV
jgi:hypothetical protein